MIGSAGKGSVRCPAADWHPPDDPSEIRAVAELLDAVTAHDGVAAVSGHVLEAVRSGQARWLLAGDPSRAEPVGVAVALASDPAEVAVHPAHRRRGYGAALVGAAVARQGAVWAYGDLPAAQAAARSLGLGRGRVLLQLRRALPADLGPLEPPPAVRIRQFVPGRDDAAIVEINARAFAWHPEQGRMTLADLRAQMAESWFDPAGLFLAVTTGPGERILGFHWTKVHPTDPTPRATPAAAGLPVGEVYLIAVDPRSEVRGLGAPLMAAGLDHLAATGLRTVMLYVEADNELATRLHRRLGFETSLTNAVYASAPGR